MFMQLFVKFSRFAGSFSVYALSIILSLWCIQYGVYVFLPVAHIAQSICLFVFRHRFLPWIFVCVWLFAEAYTQTAFGLLLLGGVCSGYVAFILSEKTIVNRSWISAAVVVCVSMATQLFIWYFGAILAEGYLVVPFFSVCVAILRVVFFGGLYALVCFFFLSRVSSFFGEQLLFHKFYFWRPRTRV
jgi:hypothetical protein